ncbi:MAG: radical SAM protein [Candidatus Omnitrophota bacterium]|jgi:radical SAM superfamily enzyme YgiQ (UPF0313 family)
MRVLFILPALNEKGSMGVNPRPFPCLTVSTATYIRNGGVDVRVLDAFLENISFEAIVSEVKDYGPDVIAVPLSEVNRCVPVMTALSLIQRLKKSRVNSTIVSFGRQDTEFIRRHLRGDGCIDYHIAGDPEETMLDLMRTLAKNRQADPAGIGGLLYKNKEEVVFTGVRITDNIDRIGFPDWSLIGLSRYSIVPHRYKNTGPYPIFETRGCLWGKCIFCQDGNSNGEPFRTKSPGKIAEEIVYARERYACKEIQFLGQQFNTDKDWLLLLESEFKKNKINTRWSCLSRVDKVNPESLSVMKRLGCWNILFGIESTNESLLKSVNKGITGQQIRDAVFWCRNEGIEVTGSFMMGLPGEKPKDVYNSVSFACHAGIDYVQLFIAKWPNERSEFKNEGYLTESCDFSQYDFGGRVLVPLAYNDFRHLKRIQRSAYQRFYFHPRTILKHLGRIRSVNDFKRLCSGARVVLCLLGIKKAVCHRLYSPA